MYTDISPVFRVEDNSLVGYNKAKDIDAIKNSLNNLFLIRLGEVPGLPWYGNGLYEILFDPIDQFTTKFIKEHISNQLDKYEPRVKLIDIVINNIPEYNKITVQIKYMAILEDEQFYDSIILKDLNTVMTSRTNI